MPDTNANPVALVLGHLQDPIASMPTDPTFLDRVDAVAKQAREAGVQVIFVTISFRPKYVELVPGSPRRVRMEPAGYFIEGVSNALHPKITVGEDDIVIRAPRVSGFVSTDLELILRSMGIGSIALAGISTGGVVMGTLTDARDRDFGVTVLEDLCFEPNADVHAALMQTFKAPWAATVSSSADWLASL